MVEGFRNILENNGIAEEHITMLENILISNNPRITAFYARRTIEQTTEGQRRKKERVDKLRNALPREVSVAQALMIREAGTNVRVTGKLIGRLVVENMVEIAAFRCANCDEWNILEDYRDTRPRLQSEMPSDFESKNLHKKMCRICLGNKIPHMSDHKYIPARSVELHGDIEIAALLIALNKTCFNGLYRVNAKGEFNVPPGKYKNPLICDSSNLENVSNALAGATILADDYRNVTQNAQKGDFIYLDPPYHPLNNTSYFTAYTTDGFDDRDQSERSLQN
jgi:hypothetical protein